ncbi:putative MORN repeat [Trypanosoma vivax]|uniref:MORN repeat-containing protein 5 n=1 Tax=Trypanosoma vivax (strain Y486) TaxID=1055687 RepID=G0TYD4_TRYVY|nr:hypothetical protein TRVL_07852 [Trypanosoma vivax]KAH8619637.1 putative MORN repeat [Trypanosoma vivax]CCC48981.1 conserved hypothetical protein [Trypanosoma vivax Y486]
MFYTGCGYRGERTADDKRFDGQGVYTFANGDTYVGAFKDGCMHGHGTLFFTEERGGGHYVGVWENGRNVSGAFVFADGLVYGSGGGGGGRQTAAAASGTGASKPAVKFLVDSSTTGDSISGSPSEESSEGAHEVSNLARGWLYCREGDRRLWAEHLREVMPVLPLQALLGGERLPQSSRWASTLVVAPCVAAEAKTPATFAQGQPRTLSDIPLEFWTDAEQRERIVQLMRLETPPFIGAQGGAGREETLTDGGMPAMNLTLRIIKPLESEAMRRAIAAAAAAAARSRALLPANDLRMENSPTRSAGSRSTVGSPLRVETASPSSSATVSRVAGNVSSPPRR